VTTSMQTGLHKEPRFDFRRWRRGARVGPPGALSNSTLRMASYYKDWSSFIEPGDDEEGAPRNVTPLHADPRAMWWVRRQNDAREAAARQSARSRRMAARAAIAFGLSFVTPFGFVLLFVSMGFGAAALFAAEGARLHRAEVYFAPEIEPALPR
jgi:hypothetical protein